MESGGKTKHGPYSETQHLESLGCVPVSEWKSMLGWRVKQMETTVPEAVCSTFLFDFGTESVHSTSSLILEENTAFIILAFNEGDSVCAWLPK